MTDERIVAVGLLTQREVELLGHGFSRIWPIDDTPCFDDLLKAIDEAERQHRRSTGKKNNLASEAMKQPNQVPRERR